MPRDPFYRRSIGVPHANTQIPTSPYNALAKGVGAFGDIAGNLYNREAAKIDRAAEIQINKNLSKFNRDVSLFNETPNSQSLEQVVNSFDVSKDVPEHADISLIEDGNLKAQQIVFNKQLQEEEKQKNIAEKIQLHKIMLEADRISNTIDTATIDTNNPTQAGEEFNDLIKTAISDDESFIDNYSNLSQTNQMLVEQHLEREAYKQSQIFSKQVEQNNNNILIQHTVSIVSENLKDTETIKAGVNDLPDELQPEAIKQIDQALKKAQAHATKTQRQFNKAVSENPVSAYQAYANSTDIPLSPQANVMLQEGQGVANLAFFDTKTSNMIVSEVTTAPNGLTALNILYDSLHTSGATQANKYLNISLSQLEKGGTPKHLIDAFLIKQFGFHGLANSVAIQDNSKDGGRKFTQTTKNAVRQAMSDNEQFSKVIGALGFSKKMQNLVERTVTQTILQEINIANQNTDDIEDTSNEVINDLFQEYNFLKIDSKKDDIEIIYKSPVDQDYLYQAISSYKKAWADLYPDKKHLIENAEFNNINEGSVLVSVLEDDQYIELGIVSTNTLIGLATIDEENSLNPFRSYDEPIAEQVLALKDDIAKYEANKFALEQEEQEEAATVMQISNSLKDMQNQANVIAQDAFNIQKILYNNAHDANDIKEDTIQ